MEQRRPAISRLRHSLPHPPHSGRHPLPWSGYAPHLYAWVHGRVHSCTCHVCICVCKCAYIRAYVCACPRVCCAAPCSPAPRRTAPCVCTRFVCALCLCVPYACSVRVLRACMLLCVLVCLRAAHERAFNQVEQVSHVLELQTARNSGSKQHPKLLLDPL